MKRVFVVLIAAACGSSQPTTTTAKPPTTEAAVATLPDVPFDDLDHDQREEFMKQKVVPTMTPIFKNHDPKKYANFGCDTCHGEDFIKGDFEMPNPKLPKLNFADMSKFKPADIEWMKTQVWPTMGKLLKEPLYSESNPEGFNCTTCHTQEGA